VDSTGSGNYGVIVNNAVRVPGKVGQALSLNGTDQCVVIVNNRALNNMTAVTMMAWIRPTADAHWHVLDKGDGDKRLYAEGLHLTLDGRVRYTPTHAVVQSDSNTVVLNAWQHVAMTWSAATDSTRLYYNGVEVHYGSVSVGSGTINNDSAYAYTIGARGALGAVTFFPGAIDQVRLYAMVLSPGQIAGTIAADTAGMAVSLLHAALRSDQCMRIAVSNGVLTAAFSGATGPERLLLYALDGGVVRAADCAGKNTLGLNVRDLARGTYVARVLPAGGWAPGRVVLGR
jgi:hypothetical protein